jgi:hypothetical protein
MIDNLQVGGEDPGEAAENLDGHPRSVQFIATVDQTELGGAKVRLVQYATEQLTVPKMTNFNLDSYLNSRFLSKWIFKIIFKRKIS